MTLELAYSYDFRLVAVSVAIAILAAYTTLDVAGRLTTVGGRDAWFGWLIGGAVTAGIGVWSMHFVGMLAIRSPLPIDYDWRWVIISVIPAIFAAGFVLNAVSHPILGWRRLIGASFLMGSGIAGMHYIGMRAMKIPARIEYNLGLVGVSVMLAAAISWAALLITFRFNEDPINQKIWKKVVAGIVMGSAIPTMHYTGMAAVTFQTKLETLSDNLLLNGHSSFLAIGVILSTLIILSVVLLTAFFDRRIAVEISRAETLQEGKQQLQKLVEQQQTLFKVVTKIRESLDLTTIFSTTTEEVRQSLNADRVAVFHFDLNSDYTTNFSEGSFISETVLPDFESALNIKFRDSCFAELYAQRYKQGRIQVLSDLHNANIRDCHIDLLSKIQVKSQLVVPIIKSDFLWGLLCIHQCAGPREWEISEIQFVQQVATQLGVALQQSELFSQTQQQSEQLSKTLTELKQAQLTMVQAEKMSSLGRMVAGIAHEINNPISFIHGNLLHVDAYTQDLFRLIHLYQEHLPAPPQDLQEEIENVDFDFLEEDFTKLLQSMKTGTDRIREIVLSMRHFSRLDGGNINAVDIHKSIDNTLTILHNRLKARSDRPVIEIVREYGHLPKIDCYAGQLNQVFMNLLSNAIDALEESICKQKIGAAEHSSIRQNQFSANPKIQIFTQLLSDDWVSIQIIDNGPGMGNEVRSHIFEPFYTTKPPGKGTGLGLAISYQIVVEKHHGKFRCNSTPGKGTEFVIEVPVRQTL
ncbi:MAG: MHYT domain-containing protein [Leptolyngbyaceae cyanobacterium MO_188.B28]|nr:MHYT domain-containing protein [Leptolyngbyaceae cyanobacterium MO_188.B28]